MDSAVPSGHNFFRSANQTLRVWLISGCPGGTKNGLVGTVGGVTVLAAMKTSGAKKTDVGTRFAKLTKESIRCTTKTGDTPLHRAAKLGKLHEIPRHVLRIELFLARNLDQQNTPHRTPLHLAAMYGHLEQVPLEFMTKESVTVLDKYGRNALHEAVISGHLRSIPAMFLTPEFLSIPEQLYGNSILHYLAWRNQTSELPRSSIVPEMWVLENYHGETPQQILEHLNNHVVWQKALREKPATEKQKERLRYLGCAFSVGMTIGQASDKIDESSEQL